MFQDWKSCKPDGSTFSLEREGLISENGQSDNCGSRLAAVSWLCWCFDSVMQLAFGLDLCRDYIYTA